MGHSRPLFNYCCYFNSVDSKKTKSKNTNVVYKILPMIEFEMQNSGVRSNRPTNWATSTAISFSLSQCFVVVGSPFWKGFPGGAWEKRSNWLNALILFALFLSFLSFERLIPLNRSSSCCRLKIKIQFRIDNWIGLSRLLSGTSV